MSSIGVIRHRVTNKEGDIMRSIFVALLIALLFIPLFANDDNFLDELIRNAENGLAEAQFILGVCYDLGEGVVKNDKQAVYWFEKAANQGHAGAQFSLGVCYEYGKGVVRNYQTAYFWYLLAAANGNEMAKDSMNKIAKQLSSAQQSEIQARATRWFEEHQE